HTALAADDLSGEAEVLAEVGVSRGDHSAEEAPIALIVEEPDHLLGDGSALLTAALASAIGGGDEDERLIHDERGIRLMERDPHRPHPELLDEAGGVARDAREVDEQWCGGRSRGNRAALCDCGCHEVTRVARRARRSCRDGTPTSGPR